MLVAQNLTKEYGRTVATQVIKGVNLHIGAGEFVLISGKSGSGKSTLLYLLSGLEKPTTGSVQYEGTALDTLPDGAMCEVRRRDFGFVFQFYNLIDVLTVKENILYPVQLDRRVTKADGEHLDELLGLIGMSDKAGSYPHQLSGGQQQRVAIARALIMRPSIVFADEPTGNLDSVNEAAVLEILRRIVDDRLSTVVMVSHDEHHRSLATRNVDLADGKIVADVLAAAH